MPPANTLVRWVDEIAFASVVQARPCPTFGRPVRHGVAPSTAARYCSANPSDPTSRWAPCPPQFRRGGSRSTLAVSGFRLRARVGVSIPATCGRRGITPAFGYGPPHPGAGGTSTLLTSALPGAHYTPLRHPLAFGSLPGVAGYRAYLAPAISHRGEEGFSSCSACPLSSCHRFHPAEVGRSSQSAFNRPCCLRPLVAGSALRNRLSRPLARSLALWPDDSQISPRETLSIGFRNSVSLLPAIQATGLLTITPAGLSPAEQTSLCWTHHQLS